MAPIRAKESAHHLRERSSSAPSSPRSRITYSTASHGRRTSEDTDRELPMLPRKPMPNYLKPTISSAGNTCPYADKKPSLPPSAAIRLLRKRTADSASAQRSPRVINSIREKTPRAVISPLPRLPRPLPQRALKTPRTLDKSTPSRSRTLKKRRDAEPKEEVVEEEEEHSPMDKHPVAVAFVSSPSHRGDLSDDQYEGSGESMAEEELDGGKQRVRRWQPAVVVEDDGGEVMRRLKFRQEREEEERDERTRQEEETPKSIEETASKMAGKRRSKVAALVGAFETVMTLHEGETSQTDQQQEEEMVVVQGDEGGASVKAADAGEEVAVAEDVKVTAEVLGEMMEKGYEGSMDEGAKEESVVAGESDVCLTDQSNLNL